MDALARLLDAPRGRDAYLVRATLAAPWSIRLADDAPLGLIAVRRGTVRLLGGVEGGIELGPGDVVVAKGPGEALLSDAERTGPAALTVLPGMRLVDAQGHDAQAGWMLGHRHLGNAPGGSTELLMGCYQLRGEVTRRLLAALPDVVLAPDGALQSPLIDLLTEEIVKDSPGKSAVLDRLFDVLLVAALRSWATGPGAEGAGLFAAQSDPVVGPALRAMHAEPARRWTLTTLAECAASSRTTFADRFVRAVGETPMAYLTQWRMALAVDLLLDPSSTLDQVARKVSYGSAFALSTAFTRERGITPSEHRSRSAAPGAAPP